MPDWMAFNPADYVANTLHLTTRQHGGYILLICAAWSGRGILPGTDAGLMAISKLTVKEWREDGDALKAFLTRRGDVWVHERVEFEWRDAQSLITAKSKAGKEGARKRWHGRANGTAIADASQSQRQNDAPKPLPKPLPTVTPTDPVANSAHAREPASRSQLLTEEWLPDAADVAALHAEMPWLVGDLYDARMRDFRDWCAANATRTFNPAATWRGFMRKTKRPETVGETFDQRRIREGLAAIKEAIPQ